MSELSGKSFYMVDYDPEWGFLTSKEKRKLARLYKHCKPKMYKKIGKVIIIGTSGEIEGENNFKKLWTNE